MNIDGYFPGGDATKFRSHESRSLLSPKKDREPSVPRELASFRWIRSLDEGPPSSSESRFSNPHPRTLLEFVTNTFFDIGLNFFEVHRRETDRITPVFIGIDASPGNGKTYVLNKLRQYAQGYLANIRIQDLVPETTFRQHMVQIITWEQHGEAAMRQAWMEQGKGDKLTDPRKPISDEELLDSKNHFEANLERALTTSLMTIAEIPGTGAFKEEPSAKEQENDEEQWIGRPLGSQAIEKLAKKQGRFEDIDVNQKWIVLEGGPVITEGMTPFRDKFANAPNLRAAQAVARRYRKPVPETTSQWRALIEGASVPQIRNFEHQLDGVLEMLVVKGIIHDLSPEAFLRKYWNYIDLNHKILSMPEDKLHVLFRRLDRSYQMMRYVLTEQYGVPQHAVFMGINNPSLKEIGYNTEAEANAMIRYFKSLQEKGEL